MDINDYNFTNSVLVHFGQGGSVSVTSSSTTIWPQFLHLYRPLPGFSLVIGIITPFFFVVIKNYYFAVGY